SMATPHVSGAAALILQAYPELGPLDVKQLLEDTAIDLNATGKDNISGSGRIDVLEAIAPYPMITEISLNPDPTNINVTINATIFDNRDNVSYALFYLNDDLNNYTVFNALDGAFDSGTENVTDIIDITVLSEGIHIVHIRVNDSLDKWNNNTNASFTVDMSPPFITLNSTTNNSFIQSNTTIDLTINDTFSRITNVTYNYNGTNLSLPPPYDINTSGWTEGLTSVKVWAFDVPGNSNNKTFNFIIDDTPPNITSVLHNGTGIMDKNYVLWVNLTGDGGNQSYFRITGSDIKIPLVNITSNFYSINYSIPPNVEVKNANLSGYLIDNAGNLNSSNASTPISIDSLSPRINLTSPVNISYIKSGTIINFTISDTFLANVTYSLNSTQANYTNQTNITLPQPYEINTAGWNESSFDLTIWANDSLNHINTSYYPITVDDTPPNLTLTSPSSDYSTTDTSVTISGTADQDANITINNVLISSVNGTFSQNYALTLGNNNFNINASDKAGNINSVILVIQRYTLVTSSGGGGGGGGGTSGEDFNNIKEIQTQRATIFKNDTVSYAFENTLNPILNVNFTAKISAGKVASKIEVLRHTSTLVDMPAPGNVYKNVNIWVGNFGWSSDRSITNATITFAVPREWIEAFNIQETSILLYRYHNDSWDPLSTIILSSDERYNYYESSTPGFSPFAISGDPIPTPTIIQTPRAKPAQNASMVMEVGVGTDDTTKDGTVLLWVLLIVIVLSFIAAIYGNRNEIQRTINDIRQHERR
ncbi:MAG: PGF-pre-PGF domain-containing protein, partial [ANME-2 cluster archaeon]|nr:PGF-pre-PGF domain-containing protein [ANME-2 cluster archaeon]